jgi:hypothetical protein
MREVLDDGHTIGQIRRIDAGFSFNTTEELFNANIRAQSRLEPHGCLGDLGWYSAVSIVLHAGRKRSAPDEG